MMIVPDRRHFHMRPGYAHYHPSGRGIDATAGRADALRSDRATGEALRGDRVSP